jgi:hypothetical protein
MVFSFSYLVCYCFSLLSVLLPFVGYFSSYCLYEAVLVGLLGFVAKIAILFPGSAFLLAGLLARDACGYWCGYMAGYFPLYFWVSGG